MRRILFVGQTGELGGAELMLLDIVRHYRARCHVLLLADGPFRRRLEDADVSVSVLPAGRAMLGVRRAGGPAKMATALPALAKVVWHVARFANSYDILYPNSQKAAVVAMLAGRLARKPVLWHLHDILSAEHFSVLQRRGVVALANRLASRVIANSQASRDAFVACGGNAELVAVVPNGIDATAFDAAPAPDIAPIRARGSRLIGLFGRIAPWKGQHVLIDALPRLPGVNALIVGDALFGETDYKARQLSRAAELGVADRVHWLGFRDDVPALMRAVDVVVHASTAPEPFGRVIVESMLARRPVVAAAGGATAELLGAGYEYLVTPNDAAALAGAIARLLAASSADVEQRTEAAFNRATALFSLSAMMAAIDRELGAIQGRARPRPLLQVVTPTHSIRELP